MLFENSSIKNQIQETCLASWQSVKAAFILTSIVSWQGGLYISALANMATPPMTPRFHRGDFQNTFPPGEACLASRHRSPMRHVGNKSNCSKLDTNCWMPASWHPTVGCQFTGWLVQRESVPMSGYIFIWPSSKAVIRMGGNKENTIDATERMGPM